MTEILVITTSASKLWSDLICWESMAKVCHLYQTPPTTPTSTPADSSTFIELSSLPLCVMKLSSLLVTESFSPLVMELPSPLVMELPSLRVIELSSLRVMGLPSLRVMEFFFVLWNCPLSMLWSCPLFALWSCPLSVFGVFLCVKALSSLRVVWVFLCCGVALSLYLPLSWGALSQCYGVVLSVCSRGASSAHVDESLSRDSRWKYWDSDWNL